jgi:hypothetical protein
VEHAGGDNWRALNVQTDRVTGQGIKTCPMCAESVKAEAQVCRFCGHAFEGSGPARRKRRWRLAVALLVGVPAYLYVAFVLVGFIFFVVLGY